MPPTYNDVGECRELVQDYIAELETGTDDDDPELRNEWSTRRYKQDLRWFDTWLDTEEIDDLTALTSRQSSRLGRTLATEFNGTTPLYRWDRIHAFYEWLVSMEVIDANPLDRWNDRKKEKWGMSKTTEQSRQLDTDEQYAVTQDEIRQMEDHVGSPRLRNQLLIRLLWQTGIRRSEASELTTEMVQRDKRELHLPGGITKNGNPRHIAYQSTLDGLLNQWLDVHRDDYLGDRDHDYVFCGRRGAQLSGAAINEVVVKAADNAGINERIGYTDANDSKRWRITSHAIRHGYGSHMVNNIDAGLWEVSKQMGHSSVKITEDIYVEDDPKAGIEHGHKYGPK